MPGPSFLEFAVDQPRDFACMDELPWNASRNVPRRVPPGLGLVFPALSAGSLRVLPAELLAQGSGAINFARQLSGAFGVNLLVVTIERPTLFHADALAATQTPDNAAAMTLLAHAASLTKGATLPEFQQMPAAAWFLGETTYLQANTLAYSDGFLITAIVFAAALLPTWLLDRSRSPKTAAFG